MNASLALIYFASNDDCYGILKNLLYVHIKVNSSTVDHYIISIFGDKIFDLLWNEMMNLGLEGILFIFVDF